MCGCYGSLSYKERSLRAASASLVLGLRQLPSSSDALSRTAALDRVARCVVGFGCFAGRILVFGLERLSLTPAGDVHLWLLTHADLRKTARVRTFIDFITTAVRQGSARFTGEG